MFQFMKYYYGFITRYKIKTQADIFVEVYDSAFQIDSQKRNKFLFLYEVVASNRIALNYSISIIHLSYLLKGIIQKMFGTKGFYLHCSSIISNNGLVLFVGPSGAGKSTTASLLSDKYDVFTDDDMFVRRSRGIFYGYKTPLLEKSKHIIKTSLGYPIHTMLVVEKSTKTFIRKVNLMDKEQARKLFAPIQTEYKYIKKTLDLYFKLVSSLKHYGLFYVYKNDTTAHQHLKKLTTL